MNKSRLLNRRRFLAVASGASGGFWCGTSNSLPARVIRGFCQEMSAAARTVTQKPVPFEWDSNRITAAWLGHATVLVNFYGVTILTDPVLSSRVGPDMRLGTVGPRRRVAPALMSGELPPIDLILISHAHFDHLDLPTLNSLPPAAAIATAPNTSGLFAGTPHRAIRELRWNDTAHFETKHGPLSVTSFKVEHWGARWRHDKGRGYNGYLLSREGKQIVFGGDTALCDHFRGLRSKGPVEFAIMPIGSYEPDGQNLHCTPEEAVRMNHDIRSPRLLPVHHLTFPLGKHPLSEPIERLQAALPAEQIGWTDVGATFSVA